MRGIRCDFLKHGEKIPKIFTDVDQPGGADVNAGLMVISPDKGEYDSMIKELTSPLETWMGPDKHHKGSMILTLITQPVKNLWQIFILLSQTKLFNEALLG